MPRLHTAAKIGFLEEFKSYVEIGGDNLREYDNILITDFNNNNNNNNDNNNKNKNINNIKNNTTTQKNNDNNDDTTDTSNSTSTSTSTNSNNSNNNCHHTGLGSTPLHIAAQNGNLEIVQYIIHKSEESIHDQDCNGFNALHMAAFGGFLEIVQCLIEFDALMITKTNNQGATALHIASFNGYVDIVEYLIAQNPKLFQITCANGYTALDYACQAGHLENVNFFIARDKTVVHCHSLIGHGPLHVACHEGRIDIIRFLLDRDSTIMYEEDSTGLTGCDIACFDGHLNVVKLMVNEDKGILSYQSKLDGHSCIHVAAQEGKVECVQYITSEMPSTLNLKDENGDTPLHQACREGHVSVVEHILQLDMSFLEMRTNDGYSPMDIACQEGHLELVEYFVTVDGKTLLDKDKNGLTPLHIACSEGHTSIVEFIVNENKATMYEKTKEGYTCIDFTCKGGFLPILQFFYSIDNKMITMKNEAINGYTPLHIACQDGFYYLVDFIVSKEYMSIFEKSNDGQVPILLAKEMKHEEIIKFLEKVYQKVCRLHHACNEKRIEDVKKYIIQGDDLYTRYHGDGWTPLHYACSGDGCIEIVKWIAIKDKKTLSIKDKFGHTPLNVAIQSGNLAIAFEIMSYAIPEFFDENDNIIESAQEYELSVLELKAQIKDNEDLLNKKEQENSLFTETLKETEENLNQTTDDLKEIIETASERESILKSRIRDCIESKSFAVIDPSDIIEEEALGGAVIGEFGNMYCGVWKDRKVATKTISTVTITDSMAKELRTLRLYHSNILPILGVCFETNAVVMPYVSRGSLYDILGDVDPTEKADFPSMDRVRVVNGIISALQYMHDRDILHYNLKSTNILIDRNFNAKISDYGFKKVFHADPNIPLNTFTIGYSAPETLNLIYEKSSDIYSVGIIIMELVTGLRIFSSNRKGLGSQTLQNRFEDSLEDADIYGIVGVFDKKIQFAGDEAEALGELILGCVQHSRKKRFTIDEMKAIIDDVDIDNPTVNKEMFCVICMEKLIDCKAQPCDHAVTCQECSSKLLKEDCPLCRCTVQGVSLAAKHKKSRSSKRDSFFGFDKQL